MQFTDIYECKQARVGGLWVARVQHIEKFNQDGGREELFIDLFQIGYSSESIKLYLVVVGLQLLGDVFWQLLLREALCLGGCESLLDELALGDHQQ